MAIPLKALYQADLATPAGLFRLLRALMRNGSNLLVLLEVAAQTKGEQIALAEPQQTITYTQLYQQSLQLAAQWKEQGLKPKQNIGLMGENHYYLVVSLFALSALGVNCFLLPPSLPLEPFQLILQQQQLDGLVYDLKDLEMVERSNFEGNKWFFQHLTLPNVQHLLACPLPANFKLPRCSSGQLVTLSGGSTGTPKRSSRKPTLKQFLSPFFALLDQLKLQDYNSIYLATPIYHGFGLATLITAIALKASITVLPKFDKTTVYPLLLQQKVQVWVTVPSLLPALLEESPLELFYPQLILSGGAPLPPSIIQKVQEKGSLQMANMYGTSEAGFCILANWKALQKHPTSIGKAIQGATLRIVNTVGEAVALGEIGSLQVQTAWRAQQQEKWVDTDDLAYQNEEGYYFLQGRQSDRIVSGGVNVYPLVVQHLLERHPQIAQAAVVGVPHEKFGEVLAAYIVPKKESICTLEAVKIWLKEKASKEQQPKQWKLVAQLPLTAVGKLDKKALLKL